MTVLQEVVKGQRTYWQNPGRRPTSITPSLRLVEAVVAAPILDAQHNVIGVLYGERTSNMGQTLVAVSQVEATLVEILAAGVATGLARQKYTEAAVRFEQFFTPKLARQLIEEPQLLEGRQLAATMLFCDIRGFSRVSERFGPAETMRWIGDVMNVLSECVLREDGVLVDYVGDEMFAMFGAPEAQPDQAERAARTALAIVEALPALNARWGEQMPDGMDLGIGVNTGEVQVGNTGSSHKFKYGPLGNAVNLASRVQGLTKYLHCRFLVTEATRRRLGEQFIARKVCRARVVNIEEPVLLYEVARAGNPDQAAFFEASEQALEMLEADPAGAARSAGELLGQQRGDGPMLLVLSEASRRLMERTPAGAPFIWKPPGK